MVDLFTTPPRTCQTASDPEAPGVLDLHWVKSWWSGSHAALFMIDKSHPDCDTGRTRDQLLYLERELRLKIRTISRKIVVDPAFTFTLTFPRSLMTSSLSVQGFSRRCLGSPGPMGP